MQIGSQVEAAKQLLALAGSVSSAGTRIEAVAHIWVAVVGLDLRTRAARRGGEPGQPAVELRAVLSDPAVSELVSASNAGTFLTPLTGLIFINPQRIYFFQALSVSAIESHFAISYERLCFALSGMQLVATSALLR